ncbi:cuticle protein 7-like [Eriocheir sinensis]|uniref:cuticle protein 7-like n=1 Tax=Eriocheir sinensis TaxID=95602 RepID=UPI0021C5DFAD|nr:cuticle protein 7-like [Eriocheir sinensis]
MSLRFVLAACLVVVALADRPAPYHPTPSYGHPAPPHPESPPKYTYNYGVADDYSGTNFGHSESRDGYKTEGSYTVNLPDGRIQTVTYVDNGDGLEAVVTYEGEPKYPEHSSYPAPPPPSYPAPPQPSYPAPLPAEPAHPEE